MDDVIFNGVKLDIPDDEEIALNKQVNDIGELSMRRSDFTREFKVKRTKAMELLFENAGLISSQTDIPYIENDCIYLSGGLQQIPSGKIALVRTDDDYYYINIYSGAKNLFDDLSKLTLNDLDLSDLSHTWNIATMKASIVSDLDYQYLLFDPSDDGGLVPNSGNITINGSLLRPFVKIKRLWDQIWIDNDVTCVSDIGGNALFEKMFQGITTTKVDSSQLTNLLSTYKGNFQSFIVGLRTQISLRSIIYPDATFNSSNDSYNAKITGKHYFKVDIPQFVSRGSVSWTIGVNINSTPFTITPEIVSDVIAGLEHHTFNLDLVATDYVTFYATYVGYSVDGAPIQMSQNRISVYCYNIEQASIGYGSTVNLNNHLEGIKQSDFIKAICNLFALIPSWDELTRTITFWSINTVIENKGQARNWSKYLSVDDAELGYTIDGYQQQNHLKYKADDDVKANAGNFYISCDNKTLEKERDMLVLPVCFSDEVTHQTELMARIGWYESVAGSASYKAKESMSSRWVTRESMTHAVYYTYGAGTETMTAAQAKRASVQYLSFGNNIGNYAAIQYMLTKTKVLNVKMNLPAREIMELDHKYPIYLDQYAAYFYVNSVKNWRNGYLCDVTLIRL